MKKEYFAPLMEMRKFNKENIVTTASGEIPANENVVTVELQKKMQEKVDTAIDKGVFNYSTGW